MPETAATVEGCQMEAFHPFRSRARLRRQLVERRLGLFQIARVEAFGEPPIDRSEKIASLIALSLITPEPRHAHCGAEFPGFGLLLTSNGECALEICLRLRGI